MRTTVLLTVALLSISFDSAVHAQPAGKEGKQTFVIAHRLDKWRTEHFDDQAKAQKHADTLKKLGAEVRTDQHDGHIDVAYRLRGWRPLRVESDAIAHQWEDWLRTSGFETLHGHSPDHDKHDHHEGHDHEGHDHGHEHGQAASHGEVVLYRAPAWLTQHFDQPEQADEFIVLTTALRCKVEKTNHAGHTDIRFACPEWTAVEFPNHNAAVGWIKWLESAGFEVQHNDDHDH